MSTSPSRLVRDSDDPYLERDFSPDGDLIVEYSIHPQLMSHETRMPRLIDAATGEVLLSMPDSLYDGLATWLEGTRLSLAIRHYDDGGSIVVAEVDWGRRTITIGSDEYPLAEGRREIARAFGRSKR